MDFGMPTLIETPSLHECVSLCRRLGLRFIELNMNLPQYQVDLLDANQLRRIREEDGVYCTIHLDENTDIAHFNPRIAEAYAGTVMATIALAKDAGIPILNLHMPDGVYFTLPEGRAYLYERYHDAYMSRIRSFRARCEEAIGASGVRIAIENTGGFPGFALRAVEHLLQSEVFVLTYDAGHACCAGGADDAFYWSHPDKLRHMHLHDAAGARSHLALGDGEADIAGMLALADRQGCRVVLETKTVAGLEASARRLPGFLAELKRPR